MNRLSERRIYTALLGFLVIIMISGCEKINPGEPFSCKIGTKYLLENIVFSIDSISDYRCPKDVICIWGGDVDLYFTIYTNHIQTDTLIGLYRNNPVSISNYEWRILEVSPWPNSGQTIDQKDYRIQLVIQKN
jgi:hypothetical protein